MLLYHYPKYDFASPSTSVSAYAIFASCYPGTYHPWIDLNRLTLATMLACHSAHSIESIVNELNVADCTLEHAFHSSSYLSAVTEFTFFIS